MTKNFPVYIALTIIVNEVRHIPSRKSNKGEIAN